MNHLLKIYRSLLRKRESSAEYLRRSSADSKDLAGFYLRHRAIFEVKR